MKLKYKNKPCEHNGQAFRSRLERHVYATLKLMECAGQIKDIQREVPIEIAPGITHKLDFLVLNELDGSLLGIEAKGVSCPTWSLKRRLYKAFSPFKIEVWGALPGGRVGVTETIQPGAYKWIKK